MLKSAHLFAAGHLRHRKKPAERVTGSARRRRRRGGRRGVAAENGNCAKYFFMLHFHDAPACRPAIGLAATHVNGRPAVPNDPASLTIPRRRPSCIFCREINLKSSTPAIKSDHSAFSFGWQRHHLYRASRPPPGCACWKPATSKLNARRLFQASAHSERAGDNKMLLPQLPLFVGATGACGGIFRFGQLVIGHQIKWKWLVLHDIL